MFLGYNTNGLSHHDLFDAIRLLADIGYRSVAITIDHGPLDPRRPGRLDELERLHELLDELELRSVIETGARFLLDPRHKHEPTLLSPRAEDRARRVAFYEYAVDVAATLSSDCVSIWSGTMHEKLDMNTAMERLVDGLQPVLDYAAERGVLVGFEPEPGMLIDTMDRFEQLLARIDSPQLRLTLDVGHLHCQGEVPISQYIHIWSSRLVNVHIEDMRAGVHEHLMFGEGEMQFPPILEALRKIGYKGGVHVELSRHSHEGSEAAEKAMAFLTRAMKGEV
ncbi:MAG: sugar phosphate isomerase/epimerase [Pirellulales bacterium]|nr:sugar phosphate isomerase/epimerase [Pirellulales bacterium]